MKHCPLKQSHTKDLSLSKKTKRSKTTITYFDTQISNRIDGPPPSYAYVNVSQKESVRGVEYSYMLTRLHRINFLRISYTDYKPFPDAEKVPDYKLTATIGLEKNKWQSSFILKNVGQTIGEDYGVPSYTVLNCKFGYDVNEAIDVFVNVHNVFNEDYETTKNYSEPRRTLYVGTTYVF